VRASVTSADGSGRTPVNLIVRAMGSHLATALGLLALLLLQACSSPEETAKAEAAVVQFHVLLDAGETRAIYANASPDLKKVSTETDFVALLEAIHRKLGPSHGNHHVHRHRHH
jgi:hypothetical protein